MWFILALVSALAVSVRQVRLKQLMSEYGQFKLGFVVQALSLPIILAATLLGKQFINPVTLGLSFWWPTLTVCIVFFPINVFLYTQAIKHGELSKILPIQSLKPLMAMLFAWILLAETPSQPGIAGIAVIVLGIYVLHLKQRRLHNPLRPFIEDRRSLYMLLGVISVSIMLTLDKIAMQESNAVFYSLVNTLIGSAVLYACALLAREPKVQLRKRRLGTFIQVGALQSVTSTAYLMALAIGPVAYVSAVRSSSVMMAAGLGIVYLKETLTRPKIAAFALIIFGSALLAVS